MDKLYTCVEIASRYGLKHDTVREWIRTKKLPAVKIGKEYRIYESDIAKFEAARKTT